MGNLQRLDGDGALRRVQRWTNPLRREPAREPPDLGRSSGLIHQNNQSISPGPVPQNETVMPRPEIVVEIDDAVFERDIREAGAGRKFVDVVVHSAFLIFEYLDRGIQP